MFRRRISVIGLLIILLLAVSACKSADVPAPTELVQTEPAATQVPPPAVVSSQAPASVESPVAPPETRVTVGENTATIAFNQEFDMLNPLYAQALSAQIVYGIWNCRAWDFDSKENVIPYLVNEIPSIKNGGISSDGREITLILRDDIVWSDGEPITSEDFVFTYQMIINPANNIQDPTPYDQVEEVRAPDPKTVIVRYKEANPAWLHTLWKVLLPKHILEREFVSEDAIQEAPWNFNPDVGCGPFIYESRVVGESFTFKTNEKSWLDFPVLGKIIIRFYPDDTAKAQAIIAGDVDLSIFLVDGATQIPILQNANMQILTVNSGYKEGIFFFLDPTNGHKSLQDVRVRQAIAMAIDRGGIIQSVYQGGREPAVSYWDNTPYIDPSLQAWTYELEKAKSLLDEAGWVDSNGNGSRDKDGVELSLTYGTTTSTTRQSVQAEIQKTLAEIGVLTVLSNYDTGIFFADIEQGGPASTGQLDIFEYSVRTSNYPDPGTNDFLCDHIPTAELPQGENWSYVCDEELNSLFKLQATQIDTQERQQTFHSISKIIFDEAYFVGLWNDPDFWSANPRLKNVQLSGITPFYNIRDWDVQP